MRVKRVLVAAVLTIATAGAHPEWARAGSGNNVNAGGEGGQTNVEATSSSVISTGSGGASVCDWEWLTYGQIVGLLPSLGIVLSPEESAELNEITIGGVVYRVYQVRCPSFTDLRLVDATVSALDLIADLRDYADGYIQLPSSWINPSAEAGGVVNLGMWLAAEDVSYDPITARAGAAWITLSPEIGSTTFDFGNGDRVTCDLFGTPIVDVDTVEQGPCGYTYRQPGEYTVSITSSWNLPYTSSSGPGALPAMNRTTTLTYRVREIVTVGASG